MRSLRLPLRRHLASPATLFFSLITAIAITSGPCRADGTKPPASGELFNGAEPDAVSRLKADTGMTAGITDANGTKMIKVDVAKFDGYPGINFPVPDGGWDLSGFTGVQIPVSNPGTVEMTFNLKIDNAGDWKSSPWNIDMIKLLPGESKLLKVYFGRSFNQPGFKLDPAHVTALRLYVIPPKSPTTILAGNPVVFKGDAFSGAVDSAPPPSPDPVPPQPLAPPVFPPTPLLDIGGKHSFPDAASLSDDAAAQLKGLCTVAEFQALPEGDRHVYSFDVWSGDKDSLDAKSYAFNFNLGTGGVTAQKVAFIPDGGGPGGSHTLARTTDAASKQSVLGGFGNLDWGGKSTYSFKFNKPVLAFAVVLKSTGDFGLRRFYWAGAHELNGYPVSYTLSDGTVVQLGKKEELGATIKGDTNALVGVIDHSGRGIVSITYSVVGLAGNKAQGINLLDLAFVTMPRPATASVIGLAGSYDFENPDAIQEAPSPMPSGLVTLDDFRFIVANHRFVYNFATWPQATPDLGSNTGVFSFDLKGKGEVAEKVTVTATDSANTAKLTQVMLKNEDGQSYPVLGGLGDVGKGAWAAQTFKFEKPVWAAGVTYSSTGDLNLAKVDDGKNFPVSYTLSDGTVVNIGTAGSPVSVITAQGKTFVGVIDTSDKGIASITFRVQGTAVGAQPVYIDDLAFAIAGPPPGDFKLTMHDEFDGDKLNPAYWATGYTFPDVINNEWQAYVPENVVVGNGVCSIKVEHKQGINTDRTGRTGQTMQITSGAFTSYDKFTQTYGYFEARIKMPKAPGVGLWPAFWMLADRGKDWPEKIRKTYRSKDYGMGSEIDIFEFMPYWKMGNGLFPIHCGTIWSYGKVTPTDPAPHGYGSYGLSNDGWGPAEMPFPNADGQFHTYGLYWSAQRLIFYVDSKPIYRVKDEKNVPDVPEYFLFNVATSGNGWGRTPRKYNPTLGQVIAGLPNEMQIDYFRAYSGTLDEAIPAPPEDMPVIRKYTPPPPEALSPPPNAPAATAPSPEPAPATAPAAPVNSTITTPSNG